MPHVSVHAWALGCFQSYQYPNLSEGTDHISGQLCGDKKCHFSGVTKCGSLEEGGDKKCHFSGVTKCGSLEEGAGE